MSIRRSFFC